MAQDTEIKRHCNPSDAEDVAGALHRRADVRNQNGKPLKVNGGSGVNYLCSQIQKSGLCVVDDTTVMNLLVHYFDENEIEEGGNVNCNIVVGKPELSEGDKANLKEQAMEQYKEEQLRELRRQNQPKPQAKATHTAPKAGAEINVQQGNLFGEDF